MASSPFILPRGTTPLVAPPGFPPDVAPNQIIYASHINAIRDSVAVWPGNVDGNNKNLTNVAAITATGAITADALGLWGDLTVEGVATVKGGVYPTPAVDIPNLEQYVRLGAKGIVQAYGGGPYLAHNSLITAGQWKGLSNGGASILECSADRISIYSNSSVLTGAAFTPAEIVAFTSAIVTVRKTLDVAERLRATGDNPPATGQGVELAFNSGAGRIDSYDRSASAYRPLMIDANGIVLGLKSGGGFAIDTLPSTNPGAGSKQLWYDPADGNRVKFAP